MGSEKRLRSAAHPAVLAIGKREAQPSLNP